MVGERGEFKCIKVKSNIPHTVQAVHGKMEALRDPFRLYEGEEDLCNVGPQRDEIMRQK